MPEADKNQILLSLIKGQDPQLGARLLQRYRASTETPADAAPTERRTVGELLEAADRRLQDREQAEIRRQAEMRTNYLDDLALREEAVWRHIEELVALRQAKAYTEAVSLLKDLQELNLRKDRASQFKQRCDDLYARHQRKKAFIDRIKQAGLQ